MYHLKRGGMVNERLQDALLHRSGQLDLVVSLGTDHSTGVHGYPVAGDPPDLTIIGYQYWVLP